MPEIAYTSVGRNALLTGLISHIAALLIALMPVSGEDLFFSIVSLFSCLVLSVGAYAELKIRGGHPLRSPRFYIISAVTVFPLLGPFIVFGLLYRLQSDGQKARIRLTGLLAAILRLKANALVIFGLIMALLLCFAVIHSRQDPYFKRRGLHISTKPGVVADQHENFVRIVKQYPHKIKGE